MFLHRLLVGSVLLVQQQAAALCGFTAPAIFPSRKMTASNNNNSNEALLMAAAFGSDDSDSEDETAARAAVRRDAANGILAFHDGTEQALLLYVQQHLQADEQQPQQHNRQRQRILQLVDDFCVSRHWMMHVGAEKGVLLQDFLRERLQQHKNNHFVVVELGTYCGYSAIRMADTILKHSHDMDFTILTVDVNPKTQQVAR